MIPLLVGLAASGFSALGLYKGKEGLDKVEDAKRIAQAARKRYEDSVNSLQNQWNETERLTTSYEKLRFRVTKKVVTRFVGFIQRNGQKASYKEDRLLESLEGISLQDLREFESLALDVKQLALGVRDAATAGAGAYSATVGIANAVGTVAVPQFFGLFTKSVGVSQLGLPGVAAYLGGGNLLIGGAVLGGATIAPALAVGGFHLSGCGEKVLTEACKYSAEVNQAIAKNKTAEELLVRTEKRIRELGKLIRRLEDQAIHSLDSLERKEKAFYNPLRQKWRRFQFLVKGILGRLLEAQNCRGTKYQPDEFDVSRHALEFQKVALLVKALVEIVKVPVLNQKGDITDDSAEIQRKYQSMRASLS